MRRAQSVTFVALISLLLLLMASFGDAALSSNSFFIDNGSTIDKVSPTGVVTPYATLPANTTSQGMAIDSSGNLFVASYGDGHLDTGGIYKVTPGGTVSTFVSGLDQTTGLAFDGSGNLYAGSEGGGIVKINPSGAATPFAPNNGESEGLAFDSHGNLFYSVLSGPVYEVTPGGVLSTFAQLSSGSDGLAFDQAGNLYATNVYGSIQKITSGGTFSTIASGLSGIQGMASDSSGNLFIDATPGSSPNMYEVSPTGSVTTFSSDLRGTDIIAIPNPVPEPSSLVSLLIIGLAATFFVGRRRVGRRNGSKYATSPTASTKSVRAGLYLGSVALGAALLQLLAPATLCRAGIINANNYTGITLYELGENPGGLFSIGFSNLYQFAAGGQVAGYASNTTNGAAEAALWTQSAPAGVSLNPAGAPESYAYATNGTNQAGVVYSSHGTSYAALWSGTAGSVVNLNPSAYTSSVAYGVAGNQQVGVGYTSTGVKHPVVWDGSASTYADLTPQGATSGIAYGTDGTYQVGEVGGAAEMWKGSASSAVSLATTVGGVGSSIAYGVGGGQQVGQGGTSNASYYALLWSGSSSSAVDLNPTGYAYSFAGATNGVNQVGYGYLAGGDGEALIWNGSASSAFDLQNLLPGYVDSVAASINSAGDVFGYAQDQAGYSYAVEWEPTPEPGGLVVLGLACFALLRRPGAWFKRRGASCKSEHWLSGNRASAPLEAT